MTDFDFDCKEKKAIARSAFHKKNGSKSKGCHLPSDDLTSAQRKKLNGPCKAINLDRPMTRKEFEELSFSLQDTYLKRIAELYDPSTDELRSMLKCDTGYVTRIKKEHNISGHKFGGYNKRPKGHAEMWAAFCNGVVGGGDNETRINITPGVSIPAVPLPEYQDPQIISPAVKESLREAATIHDNSKDLDQLRFERDFYKERYFELLAILGERK